MNSNGKLEYLISESGKKYVPPKLIEFGKVRELTTGGSGVPPEKDSSDTHPNKHP